MPNDIFAVPSGDAELIKLEQLGGETKPVLPEQSLSELNKLIRVSQSTVTQVSTIEDKRVATERGVQMQKWIKDCKEAKARVKAPLNLLLDNIDALADTLINPALAEKERLGKLITQFDRGEQLRIEQENIERTKRINAARQVADQLAREALQRANDFADESQLESAIAAERNAAEALAREREIIVAPMPSSERVKGNISGKSMTWKVTDINALYKARPELCKIEPYPAMIRALVVDGSPPIPGLEVVWEKRTTFRT